MWGWIVEGEWFEVKVEKIINRIKENKECKLINRKKRIDTNLRLPNDLKYFYEHYDSLEMFIDNPFGMRIVPLKDLVVTNNQLYSKDDVIWDELEGDISNKWYIIAEAEQLGQYVSIELGDKHFGYCYDSNHETHANPGYCQVIAKSFSEFLERLYECQGEGTTWFWLEEDYPDYGDAYDKR